MRGGRGGKETTVAHKGHIDFFVASYKSRSQVTSSQVSNLRRKNQCVPYEPP